MNEGKIINFLRQKFSTPNGIGDDAAILAGNYVVSQDLLVEDIHFRTRYVDSKSLAYKGLQVNLSDIAAMGAKALYVMLAIAIPDNYDQYIDDFLSNFAEICTMNNLTLIGGDTTASPDKLFINITIIGTVNNPKRRDAAGSGDVICVAGNLGYAHLGLEAFEKQFIGFKEFKESFLKPQAAVQEGLWLGGQVAVTAMMDISDGLFVDLKKLCQASSMAAMLCVDNLKASKKFLDACRALELDPISVQLMGGEDYGLLITVKEELYKEVSLNFLAKFSYPLKNIGKIITGNAGEVLFDQDFELKLKAFSHFGELK